MTKFSRSRNHEAVRQLRLTPRLVAAVALTLAGSAQADVLTWVGNTSANWNAANWTGGLNPTPQDFDSLSFGAAGTAGTVLTNGLGAATPITVAGITFEANASAYTFNGNGIGLIGPVANNSTNLQTINLPLDLQGQQTFTANTGGGDITLGGVISGFGGITKAGTGTLTLSNSANSYTGETIFGPGIINVASVSDYGIASSIGARDVLSENNSLTGISLHFLGGTLQYTGSTPQSTNRQIRMLNGNGATIDASGSVETATLSFTHTGPNINLFDTPGVRTLTLTGTNTGENSFSIQLTDQAASATNLSKTGSGTWMIANSDNTNTGEIFIAGGILNVASVSDYGIPSSIGARTAAQENTGLTGVGLHFLGGTLQYTGSTPQSTNRNIRILNDGATSGATIDASGSKPEATLSFTHTGTNMNLFDTPGERTVTLTGTNTGNNSFSIQLINQAGSPTRLAKNGTGTWVLNGPDSNTATGTTTVDAGTLVLAKAGAIAASGNVNVGNGSELAVLVISGTGGNQIADNSVATLTGSGGNAGILRLNNHNETIGGLNSFDGGIVENESGSAGTATLTVNVPATEFPFYAGILRNGDGNDVDGVLAFTKTGPGSLTLSGTTSHTGATTVNAGTLTVDGTLGAGTTVSVSNATLNGSGTIAAPVNVGNNGVLSTTGTVSGTVTLANGAKLAGTGTITGTVNAGSGSQISPSDNFTPGTLTIGLLNLSSGSVINYELGVTSDLVVVSNAGGLALNGGAFNLFEAGGVTPLMTNGSYTLFDYTTNFTGSLGNLSIANSQVGKFYNLTNDTANTQIKLTVSDAVTTEWNGSGGNNLWSTAGNWTGAVPNSPGTVAKFGATPASSVSVAVNGAKTVGGILFDNTNGYTLTGGATDTITLNNGVAAASITLAKGNHTIAAPLVLETSANATTASGSTLTISSNISGGKGLIVSGSGTTILTGANTFTTTTVNSGTLQIGNNGTTGTLGSGDILVAPGGSLVFSRSDNLTVANNISGAGAQVTKLGAGTLTLSGTGTFATADGSGFNINAGTVKLGSANALANGVVLGFNGGTLDLNGNNVTAGFLTGGSGSITDEGAGTGTTTLTVNQAGDTTFGSSIRNGAGRVVALTKGGTGALTLTGNNTFTGGVNITGGALIAAGDGTNIPIVSNVTLGDGTSDVFLIAGAAGQQFGAGTVVNFNNGAKNAKFQLRGTNQTVAGLDSTPNPSFSLSIIQNDEANTPGFVGTPGPATLTINTATDHSFAGLIRNENGGGLNLVKEGPATQEIRNVLVTTDNFTSATVNAGKLLFNFALNANNTNTIVGSTSLVANPGGTLAFDGTSVIAAIISGDGTILKQGTGTVRFDGANTFTNGLVLDSGTLEIGNDLALGASTGVIKINGGSIRAANAAREVPNPIQVNGSFTLGRLTDLNGGLTLTKDATITANNFDGPANNPSELSAISGNFRVTFDEGPQGIGSGALVLAGQNTNSGGTTINSGRVNVAPTGALAVADLVVNGGELNLNNTAQAVNGLSGTGGTINLASDHTLTINQQNAGTFNGSLGGGGTLVKRGAGALTLGGANSNYFGAVNVNGGALVVNGSINGSITVDGASSVLGGVGQLGFVTVQNGGTIAPGNLSAGTLSATGLTMMSGTKLSLEINSHALGTGYDQLHVFGSVDLGGAALSLLGSFLFSFAEPNDPFFVLINDGGADVNGTFNGIAEGGHILSSSGQDFILTYKANFDANSFTGGNDIALLAVPEPSAAISLLSGVGVLLGVRRRRSA